MRDKIFSVFGVLIFGCFWAGIFTLYLIGYGI